MSYKILVVDDNPVDLECTRLVLEESSDFEITGFIDPSSVLNEVRLNPNKYAAILLDYQMPVKNGIEVAQEMLSINPHLVIALNSADDSRTLLKKCMSIGVKDFIEKNQSEDVVRSIVHSLCQRWEDTAELFNLNENEDDNQKIVESIGIVGKSNAMVKIAQLVRSVAKADCSVLIRGESGTGKERIAQAIHNLSNRRTKPFVPVNMSSITETLFESEMFGHVKGAFTGAVSDKKGIITSANQGTLFLDEIGDLSPLLQAKLLRVIQEKKVTPVGATRSIDVDIRIISATHVNLEKAIQDGRFREDLYYRLHVTPIYLPALRERRADIRPLVSYFLKTFKADNLEVLKKTLRCLESYQWHGNIRELQNEIERLVSLRKSRITPEDLNLKIRDAANIKNDIFEIPTHQEFLKSKYEEELEYIQVSIRQAGGLREACRTIFQSSPSTISTRIKTLEKNIKLISEKKGELNHETTVN